MESNTTSETNNEIEPETKTTWIDIIFIILLINLGLVILSSVVATFLNPEYLENLMLLGIITVLVISVVIILIIVLSLVPPMLAKRVFNWDEEREIDWVVNLLFVLSFILIIGTSIGLYVLVLPFFPPVQDPFNLSGINTTLGIIYSIWWFFGFIISTLTITLLYILLEAGRYG